MSYNQLIELTRRAFTTQNAAMNVAGQNVANANTEGYSRQRLMLSADSVQSTGLFTRLSRDSVTGAGVSIQTYDRIRDSLLSAAVWEAGSAMGAAEEEHRIMSALEGLFPSSGPGSLSYTIDEFWGAWSKLADHPTDNGVRLSVLSSAENLALTFNRLSAEIDNLSTQTHEALRSGLDDLNGKLDRIAELNYTIEEARLQGSPHLSAEDERDLIVQQLSEYVPIRVQQQARGGYTITISGMAVVQGTETMHLIEAEGQPVPSLLFDGTNTAYVPPESTGGKIGAWYYALDVAIPDSKDKLDQMAGALVLGVNRIHAQAYDDQGNVITTPGANFFDPAGVTATTIEVSDQIRQNEGLIAPINQFQYSGGKLVGMANAIAALRTESIAALRSEPLTGTNAESIDSFAINFISGIGAQVHQASTRAAAQSVVVDHLNAMAEGVSAVSIDEEMTNLIKIQQAYAAAARVLSTAQSMMDTLLAL